MIQLGILELGISNKLENDVEIIEQTIELAKYADAKGYSRFWLAEHHEGGVAWRSPEILIGIIAGMTERIKVGAAGILLPLNSPLRVAQHFKFLATLFSNRIDLGLARGFTNDYISQELLNGVNCQKFFENHIPRVEKTMRYVTNNFVEIDDIPSQLISIPPNNYSFPDVWLLGTSGSTMDYCIENKINYGLSLFHSDPKFYDAIRKQFTEYIANYEKKNETRQIANITLGIICSELEEERERMVKKNSDKHTISIIGNIDYCSDKIKQISNEFNCSEIILYFVAATYENKCFVVEELAKRFNLNNGIGSNL